MFCEECGSRVADEAQFCSNCGAVIESEPPQPQAPPVDSAAAAAVPRATAPPLAAAVAPAAAPQPTAPPFPGGAPPRRRSPRWYVIPAVVVALAGLGVGLYFLLSGRDAAPQAASSGRTVTTATTAASREPEDATPARTVGAQTITVDMPYDSGEGVYNGGMKDGVPHGRGSFEMITSDTGKHWSYEGQWEEGQITGEGVMKEGHFVFSGGFAGGLLTGDCEIVDEGVLRYKGSCRDGKLHGQGTLYTKSGMLLFEGTFENDMLVESASARLARGEAFMPQCNDMNTAMYGAALEGDSLFGAPVAVAGTTLAMSDQNAGSTIVIAHMGSPDHPVCLVYRYGAGEPTMTSDDWINAWGVITGTYQYTDADGLLVTCPRVEVIHWNNE